MQRWLAGIQGLSGQLAGGVDDVHEQLGGRGLGQHCRRGQRRQGLKARLALLCPWATSRTERTRPRPATAVVVPARRPPNSSSASNPTKQTWLRFSFIGTRCQQLTDHQTQKSARCLFRSLRNDHVGQQAKVVQGRQDGLARSMAALVVRVRDEAILAVVAKPGENFGLPALG
jgi:hypothetical protein